MSAVHEAVIESVKKLGLNGSAEHTNGTIEENFQAKTICCVGAGYVGTFHAREVIPLQAVLHGYAQTPFRRLRRRNLMVLRNVVLSRLTE